MNVDPETGEVTVLPAEPLPGITQWHSPKVGNIVAALAKAQGEFLPITKDRAGQSQGGKYKYAQLDKVYEAVRAALSQVGIAHTETIRPDPQDVNFMLLTFRLWLGEEWIESIWPMPWTSNPQQNGKEMTYGRRYLALGIFSIHPEDEDDDGVEAAAGRGQQGARLQRNDPAPKTQTAPKQEQAQDHREEPTPAAGGEPDSARTKAAEEFFSRIRATMEAKTEAKDVDIVLKAQAKGFAGLERDFPALFGDLMKSSLERKVLLGGALTAEQEAILQNLGQPSSDPLPVDETDAPPSEEMAQEIDDGKHGMPQ